LSFTETDVLLSELYVDPEGNSREDYGDIEELKARIKGLGLWGRIHVSEIEEDEESGHKYVLENGYRRLRAITELVSEGVTHSDKGQDLRRIKVQVLDPEMSDTERSEVLFAINTSQKTWTPYEQAKEIQFLLDNNVEMEEIQGKLGLGELAVKQRLKLLSAPEFLQEALAKNEITATHARSILRIPNEELQREVTEKAVTEDLATRAIDRLAEEAVEKAVDAGAPPPKRSRKKTGSKGGKDTSSASAASDDSSSKTKYPTRPAVEIVAEVEAYRTTLAEADDVGKVEIEAYISALSWVLYDAEISSTEAEAPAEEEAAEDKAASAESKDATPEGTDAEGDEAATSELSADEAIERINAATSAKTTSADDA